MKLVHAKSVWRYVMGALGMDKIAVALMIGFASAAAAADPPRFEIARVDARLTGEIEIASVAGLIYRYLAPDGHQFVQVKFRLTGASGSLSLKKDNLRLLADGKEAVFYGVQTSWQSEPQDAEASVYLSEKGTNRIVAFTVPVGAKQYSLDIAGKTVDIVPEAGPVPTAPPKFTVEEHGIVPTPMREVHKSRFKSPERITETDANGAHLLRVEVNIVPGFEASLEEDFQFMSRCFSLRDKRGLRNVCVAIEYQGVLDTAFIYRLVPPKDGKWEPIREVLYFLIPEEKGEYTLHYGDGEGVSITVGG